MSISLLRTERGHTSLLSLKPFSPLSQSHTVASRALKVRRSRSQCLDSGTQEESFRDEPYRRVALRSDEDSRVPPTWIPSTRGGVHPLLPLLSLYLPVCCTGRGRHTGLYGHRGSIPDLSSFPDSVVQTGYWTDVIGFYFLDGGNNSCDTL